MNQTITCSLCGKMLHRNKIHNCTASICPDSSDILNLIDDNDLYDLYLGLGSSTPYGNQAEREVIKKLVLSINEKLKRLEKP